MTLEITNGWGEYRSKKVVKAAVIEQVGEQVVDGYRTVWFEGAFPELIDNKVFARGIPGPGDLLVVYSDGYLSWSPRKAFEEGYENA